MPINVKCVKCGQVGNLTIKKCKTRGIMYEYCYLQHYIRETKKIEWRYIGSYSKRPGKYKDKVKEIKTIHNYTQQSKNYTQQENIFNLNSNISGKRIGSSDFVVPRGRFELTTIRSSASPL